MSAPPYQKVQRYFVPEEFVLVVRSETPVERGTLLEWPQVFAQVNDISLPGSTFVNADDPSAIAGWTLGQPGSDNLDEGYLYSLRVTLSGADDNAVIAALSAFASLVSPEISHGGVWLRAATPNWLFGASQSQLITGGPGGIPVEAQDPGDEYSVVLPAEFRSSEECPVQVAIFDAAPSDAKLQAAYISLTGHALLQSLRPQLTVKYAPDFGLKLLDDTELSGYAHEPDYEVSDHGLFIAGTVHGGNSLASITLVETLNRFGAGTLQGLTYALRQLIVGSLCVTPELPLVVNLSLAAAFGSLAELQANYPAWSALSEIDAAHEWDELNKLMGGLQSVIRAVHSAFAANGVAIVAAAGNLARPGEPQPPSRYPAAFEEVVAVGAEDEPGTPSFYSNDPLVPVPSGVATYGGVATVSALTTPLNNPVNVSDGDLGMIGIYIGIIPDQNAPPSASNPKAWGGVPCATGWARWSGTSFATGLISAVLARAACSQLLSNDILPLGESVDARV